MKSAGGPDMDGTMAASPNSASPLLFVPLGADRSPCDLLYDEPISRIDVAGAREALTFAFASGDGDVFTRLLDHTPTAPSSFAAEDFARDLKLERFVTRCMPVAAAAHGGAVGQRYVLRVLCSPPDDPAHVEFRQNICAELASSPPLAARFSELYARLCHFRERVSRPSAGVQDGIERRLGILHALRAVVELLVEGFAGTSSGLGRLHDFGRSLAASDGFRRLCELCDYERASAEVDLRISVGFDGHVRGFQLLERREARSNAFFSTAVGRLWTRLCLLLAGYRASTGELLSRLVDQVFSELENEVVFFFQLIGDMEVYLAALGFRDLARRAGLTVCLPEWTERGARSLEGLFNPWLIAEGRPCVAADLQFSEHEHLVLITGPNSGGKTRLLEALCLCQLLGQSGLFVPAARAELSWSNGLFASLIEHQAVDPVEGRLGTELMRIRRAFERLRSGSMVVMDELCSGTNPSEGETLIRLVLDALLELSPRAFITSHFLELMARLAREKPYYRFLQAELDAYENPTYAFVDGVARTSLAHRVAERLGVTREALSALIRQNNPMLVPARAAQLPARSRELSTSLLGG